MFKYKQKAFTLVEVLIVVAIISILAAFAVVSLQQMRKNARDAKRMDNMEKIHSALELFANQYGRYPTIEEWSEGFIGSSTEGIFFMQEIPSAPSPADGDCLDASNTYVYTPRDNEASYTIDFCTGKQVSNLPGGTKQMTPGGIIVGSSENTEEGEGDGEQIPNVYTLTYLAGTGGTVLGNSNQNINQGENGTEVTASANIGYLFSQWSDGLTTASRTDLNIQSNLEVTAQFTIDSYTITFDKQSGTGGSDSVTATFGSAMPTASAPTRSGYVFAGYFDAVSGGEQYYSDSMTSSRNWDKSTNTILYARWTINQYTITFDGNGGGGHSPISVLANYNSTIALPSVPTRIGYTFVGWFTAISGGTQFTSSTVVTSSYIVYARWTANIYTLSFNAQGGTVSPASKLVIYNQEVGELPTPTKNGFSFEGWNTQADGNGSFYTLNTIYNINNNFTIYAIWGEIIGGPACGEITSIIDSRDNNVYKVVGIGAQCWMKENLKYLPLVHSNTEFSTRGTSALPGYGVYNYNGSDVNTAKTQTNYLIYGVLYNWYAVNQVSICPTGWHVPSDNEIKVLEGAVDSIYGIGDPVWDNTGYRGSDVGAKLAGEYNLWVDGNLRRNVNFGGSGFNFLPSGMRYSSGGFGSLGSFSGLWSSSTTGSSAWGRSFYSTDLTVRRLEVSFGSGLSVRCLKD